MKRTITVALALVGALGLLLAASGAGTPAFALSVTGAGTPPARATSLAAFGGMSGLVKAAKKEGSLNVITLPRNWANYGKIMDSFSKKYGIKITDANPDGSSQDEINAMKQLKGQSRAPDVFDLGNSFALTAAQEGLLAKYKVKTWADIPADAKAANGEWFASYGGYVAIGYDPSKVKHAPKSFKDLLKPEFKNMVGINGNPTQAGAAFAAVYAASLANGGSFNNIKPGISYFQKLHQDGNFVPVTASAATVQSGQTPVVIWWDYLEASEIKAEVPNWKIVIPTDGHYAAYYDQAINKNAPHPAAARLWEEYLYSKTGQNLWLQGFARPIELQTLVKNGTVDKKAYNALPKAPKGAITFPSNTQLTNAQTVLSQQWSSAVS